ncbi:Arc/MetJ-type ribon-helix-helix transcriptional regulator [Arcanobacterium wilhelmae]|uniref:Arc/MetJ-type ribon-helix-helix transcriptional regulator n=1 Tax=Arcanobacterium wilhelmae TaxID=1803177 RepID=A0ABT9NCT2_9ACTO|nr:YlcI/YnfO family protein [Arcanobacterium wilhelmae]MDP9801534.1 Arc/MetJ-type ribon-helix-helix transcriptional regulator [Arcanobacterium wilhelmae]WFN90861.1 YlcI/YnfO family protein [Arcanobacterium wilhelmae]
MTVQIAVRIPDELAEFIDAEVHKGGARNRTDFVTSAIERDMRRRLAMRDAQILREQGAEDDLDSLVAWSAGRSSSVFSDLD